VAEARLILVKHAMPLIREDTPSKDWLLSEEGRAAAARLGERLKAFAPAAVVASTEPKARETGAIIAAVLGLPMSTDEGLVETRRATVGWLTREGVEAGIRNLFERPSEVVYGEESADEAFHRFVAAIERHSGKTPLVVACHGTVISLYLSRRSGYDAMDAWHSLKLPHALVLGPEDEVLDSIVVEG
jgi:broad specificity phosphatase PhoE